MHVDQACAKPNIIGIDRGAEHLVSGEGGKKVRDLQPAAHQDLCRTPFRTKTSMSSDVSRVRP